MEEYKQWLEQQIERCLNDKDLQREHWAFCKAYEKFTASCQTDVMRMMVVPFAKWLRDNTVADGAPKLLLRLDMKRYTIEELYDLYTLIAEQPLVKN